MTKRKDISLLEEVPTGERRVLLHACCAPCSGAILEAMVRGSLEPVLFFSNANIVPRAEYDKRLGELLRYARELGVPVVEDAYDHACWRSTAAEGLEHEPERGRRCEACFRFRLDRAAAYAHEHGFHVLTTTLASSRWKDLEQVDRAGEAACAPYPDLHWWPRNCRKGGLQERRNEIIREQAFYNQRYCGCEFSMAQAVSQREGSSEAGSFDPELLR